MTHVYLLTNSSCKLTVLDYLALLITFIDNISISMAIISSYSAITFGNVFRPILQLLFISIVCSLLAFFQASFC